jgi:hypothetical protein
VVAEIATPAKFPPDHGRSPVAGGSLSMAILGRHKYIRSTGGSEELYDLTRDPDELKTLIRDEALQPALEQLRRHATAVSKEAASDQRSAVGHQQKKAISDQLSAPKLK